MTFGVSGCYVYFAKAAFAQHHEEVEVVDAHSGFGRAWGVHRGAGWCGGRGQSRRERFRQLDRYRLRQGRCCGVWLRLLENRSGRIER